MLQKARSLSSMLWRAVVSPLLLQAQSPGFENEQRLFTGGLLF